MRKPHWRDLDTTPSRAPYKIDDREKRCHIYGATYRLIQASPSFDTWFVTADGVPLGPPTGFEQALAGFEALTK